MQNNEETPFDQDMNRFQFSQEPSLEKKKLVRQSQPILLPVIQRPITFPQSNKYDVTNKKSFYKQTYTPKKLSNIRFKSPKLNRRL